MAEITNAQALSESIARHPASRKGVPLVWTMNLFASSGYGGAGTSSATQEEAEERARRALANGWYEVVIYGPDGYRKAYRQGDQP